MSAKVDCANVRLAASAPEGGESSDRRVVIVGASARAAVFSALRAGWRPIAVDLFADEDLRAVCETVRVERYPCDLANAVERCPAAPWLYTGGLENYPTIVDRIAARRQLYGNSGARLKAARDPFAIHECLTRAGCLAPGVERRPAGLATDGRWLLKGFRSSGGKAVCAWRGAALTKRELGQSYFQERIEGAPCAAVYLANEARCRLVGVTRQLVGDDWTGAGPWNYCGSVAPATLGAEAISSLARIGDALAAGFKLVGLFGVDAIVNEAGAWPVDLNPRYPASAEAIERQLGRSLVADHIAACVGGDLAEASHASDSATACAKAILYARADFVVAAELNARLRADNESAPAVWNVRAADIPATGTMIRAGWPIATLIEEAATPNEALARIRSRAASALSQA